MSEIETTPEEKPRRRLGFRMAILGLVAVMGFTLTGCQSPPITRLDAAKRATAARWVHDNNYYADTSHVFCKRLSYNSASEVESFTCDIFGKFYYPAARYSGASTEVTLRHAGRTCFFWWAADGTKGGSC